MSESNKTNKMNQKKVKKIRKIVRRQFRERERRKPWFIPIFIWSYLIRKMYSR